MRYKIILTALSFILFNCVINFSLVYSQEQKGVKSDTFYVFQATKMAVVLPLADYTHRDLFITFLTWGGNGVAVSTLSDYLSSKKVTVISQAEVEEFLLQQGIVKEMKQARQQESVEWELLNRIHKPEIIKSLVSKMLAKEGHPRSFSKEAVLELGKKLKADIVIRGSIYELKPQESEDLFCDLIPFLFGDLNSGVIGFAKLSDYNGNLPTLGNMKEIQSTSKEVILAVNIYIQSAKTAQVLWSDRFNIKYLPSTFEEEFKKQLALSFDSFFGQQIFYKGFWLWLKPILGEK